jgi:4-hydroxy-tetrahydrodipicolinate synthase
MRYVRTLRPIEDYRARAGDSYDISMLKAALCLAGRDFGPPQRRITADEESQIRILLEPILAAEAELMH